MMLLQTILQGAGLGVLLAWVCAIGIRKGAVGMLHLYSAEVQARCVSLGLATNKSIRRNAVVMKLLSLPLYMTYVWICVYEINSAQGFLSAFWQLLVILFVMDLIDRFLIDGLWVGHTKAWIIPGTEDLMPYITKADKRRKWRASTVGMAGIAAVLAGIGTLL